MVDEVVVEEDVFDDVYKKNPNLKYILKKNTQGYSQQAYRPDDISSLHIEKLLKQGITTFINSEYDSKKKSGEDFLNENNITWNTITVGSGIDTSIKKQLELVKNTL